MIRQWKKNAQLTVLGRERMGKMRKNMEGDGGRRVEDGAEPCGLEEPQATRNFIAR